MKVRTSASGEAAAPFTGRGAQNADPEPGPGLDDEPTYWTPQSAPQEPQTDPASKDPAESAGESGRPSARREALEQDAEDETADRPSPWFLRSRRHGAAAVAALLAVIAVILGVCTLGPVRTVLAQSFTQRSSPNPQFYLNGNPWVSGQFLNVPLGMIVQNGPRTASYKVRVWTVDAAGKTDASAMVTLPVQGGKGVTNFSLPIPADAQLVSAQVDGTSLSVHYRFAGSPLPRVGSSVGSSASRGPGAGGSH